MKKYLFNSLLTAALLVFHLSAPAADIDLYTNGGGSDSDLPNVLFVIANAAGFGANSTITCTYTGLTGASATPSGTGKVAGVQQCALYNMLQALPTSPAKVNVGVMVYAASGIEDIDGHPTTYAKGGFLAVPLMVLNDANKTRLQTWVKNWTANLSNIKANNEATGGAMQEAWAYFSGSQGLSTRNYTAPASGCGTNYIVFIGSATQNNITPSDSNNPASNLCATGCGLNNAPGVTTDEKKTLDTVLLGPKKTANYSVCTATGNPPAFTFPASTHENSGFYADEWSRYLNDKLGIKTYGISFLDMAKCKADYPALLTSMAAAGKGTYFQTTDYSELVNAFIQVMTQIQSVNSVFAAVSLPASANIQGAYLNQLYVGMFRPDPDKKPRWIGNLKQYKLGSNDQLVDADGINAINSVTTGFVSECARSYWTLPYATNRTTTPVPITANIDTYWAADPKGGCTPLAPDDQDLYKKSNTPDGNIVEKGAAAYILRKGTPASRTVKTCSSTFASCTSLIDFNNTNVTTASLGATDAAERDLLINWAKGQNIDAELNKTTTEMRPSSHGDVIHSNPLALSYGSNVVVYYGSNDGMLHAINGNQSGNIGSVEPGAELWAFMPPEFFGNIKRQRSNTPLVSIAGSGSGSPKPYAIDGPISTYQDGTDTWIYATMRRGGRALYAFRVTNPASPVLEWKIGCPNLANDTGCLATGLASPTTFSGIGQTWSLAQPVKAPGYPGSPSAPTPLLIMGGGYDDCEDADPNGHPNSCTSLSKGHGIFVLDAITGALKTVLPTDRSVVGDVRVVPDAAGLAKYAYAADLGGNLYRITIGSAAPASWTITKIASLGCATAASCTDNRKFMFAPSVIPETDGTYSLYVGSGDREKPLGSTYFPGATGVQNYFFKVKDNPTDATWLSSESTVHCPGQSVICMNSLVSDGTASDTSCSANLSQDTLANATKGWYLALRATEQVVTPAATRFGVSTFSTHIPQTVVPGTCTSKLGTTHVYNFDVATAAPAAGTSCKDEVVGGGLPPPPEKKDVCMNADCTVKESICIGCDTHSPIEVKKNDAPSYVPGQNAKRRVYWYIQK